MFLKPYRVKSSNQLKGSEKKKLKAELKKNFPSLTDDQLSGLIPAKEEVMISKIYTFGGDSLLLYVHGKSPLFFELEKDRIIFPTVYTLWKFPDLLLSFPTLPPVMPKIKNGADLMLPGIVVDRSRGNRAFHNGTLKKVGPESIFINL